MTSSHPVASGAVADIHEGTFNGRKVCVKRVRVYSKGEPRGIQEVRYLLLSFPFSIIKKVQSSIRRLQHGSTGNI